MCKVYVTCVRMCKVYVLYCKAASFSVTWQSLEQVGSGTICACFLIRTRLAGFSARTHPSLSMVSEEFVAPHKNKK